MLIALALIILPACKCVYVCANAVITFKVNILCILKCEMGARGRQEFKIIPSDKFP